MGGSIKDRRIALPLLVVGDGAGHVFEVPDFHMAGMALGRVTALAGGDLTPLASGGTLFELPGRTAVGIDARTGRAVEVSHWQGQRVFPVAACMPPGFVQALTTAYHSTPNAPPLPLYAYTAVGWQSGRFVAAGSRVESPGRCRIAAVEGRSGDAAATRMLARYPRNRLVEHLVHNCVRRYACPSARAFVAGAGECGIAVSRACNAACVGCISHQAKSTCITACHERIAFSPTVKEIVEISVPHLKSATHPVVSFGQGCEGEPLLEAPLIEDAIRAIRAKTTRGIINMNTNGSNLDAVERLCSAGLDSIRVSMNSAQSLRYRRYFRPQGYEFRDVVDTLRVARKHGLWVSVNYFVFPGFTDHPDEVTALDLLIERCDIDMIQTRNLNADPLWAGEQLGLSRLSGRGIGIAAWLAHVRRRHPRVTVGYFNPSPAMIARRRKERAA